MSRVVVASLAAVVVIAAINWGLARYLDHRVAAEAACRLPEGASVRDAEVGGNTILSLIKGRFSTIVVHSQDFPVGAAAGLKDVKVDVIMEMTDVLLDRDAAFEDRIGSVDLKMGLDAATLQDLMAARPTGSSQPVPELEIRDGVLRAIVPGQGRLAAVVLEPSVQDGDVRLTPTSVRIGTRTFAPALLENARGYEFLRTAAGADLLQPQDVEVPELMPRVDPASAQVVGNQLLLAFDVGDDGIAPTLPRTPPDPRRPAKPVPDQRPTATLPG